MMLTRKFSAARLSTKCRCESNGVVATVVKPEDQEQVKIVKTISALDALLGEEAKPQTRPPTPSNPAPAPAPDKQSGVFSWPSGTATPTKPVAPPRVAPSANNKSKPQTFESVMAFEGLAPEIINGRVAMIGYMIAIINELGSGESVYSQLVAGGFGQMLLVVLGVTLASFAPALRQVPLEEVFNKNPKKIKTFGPFTPDAELINGRAAMVALTTIVVLEGTSGIAFFLS